MSLHININDENKSIQDYIKEYFNYDYLYDSGNNKKFLLNTPEIIIIRLKRFIQRKIRRKKKVSIVGEKLKNKVSFGRKLDLNDYTIYDNNKFELYGITLHIGNSHRGGHYISYIKKPTFNINYLNKYSSDKKNG